MRMTREEAISGYIVPALKHTWNDKINNEVIKALEQEPCGVQMVEPHESENKE